MANVDLNEKQLAKIKGYLEDEGKLLRAVASTLTDKRKNSLARQYAKGNVPVMRKAALEKVRSLGFGEQIKETICTGYRWCDKRGERSYNVVINLVRILAGVLGGFMSVSLATVVFMVKHYAFDSLCDCPKPAKVF
jgi:hypothetical protein